MRIGALRYLGILPTIVRYDVLHPSKAIVIRELAKVLDDPKKSVRKEAVDTRFVGRNDCSISVDLIFVFCTDQFGTVNYYQDITSILS